MAWYTDGNLITARTVLGNGAGTVTAGLVTGAAPPLGGAYFVSTEEYNGTSWSYGGDLQRGKAQHAVCGLQDAAIAIGGTYWQDPPGAGEFDYTTEVYNGTSWSYTSDYIGPTYKDQYISATGSTTATLVAGGCCDPVYSTSPSYEFDGASWSSGGDTLYTHYYTPAMGGTQVAGVIAGGRGLVAPPPPYIPNYMKETEEYNGTSWSSGGDMPFGRWALQSASNGTQTAYLVFGGDINGGSTHETIDYNGTTWTVREDTSNYFSWGGGGGNSSTAFVVSDSVNFNITEIYGIDRRFQVRIWCPASLHV